MTSHTADRPAAVPPGGRGVAKATVDAGADGQRLDNWLIRELKGVPKSAVYRILRKGEIRVNGKRAKPEQRLAAGVDVAAAAVLFLGSVQGLVMQALVSGQVSAMAAQAPAVYAIYRRGLTG